MTKRLIPLLALLLCGCSETVCEPCQSIGAPACDSPSSETMEEKPIEESSPSEGGWKDDAKVIFVGETYRYEDSAAFRILYREFSNSASWGIDVFTPNKGDETTVRYVCMPYRIFYKEAES